MDYMSIKFKTQLSKYDIKRLVTKHKMELHTYRYLGKLKKGYKLYKEFEFHKNNNEPPF
jgi:hypothetical protein